jgi:hypothetical protein
MMTRHKLTRTERARQAATSPSSRETSLKPRSPSRLLETRTQTQRLAIPPRGTTHLSSGCRLGHIGNLQHQPLWLGSCAFALGCEALRLAEVVWVAHRTICILVGIPRWRSAVHQAAHQAAF